MHSRTCALISPSQSMMLARKTAGGRVDGRGGCGTASGEGGGTASAGGGNDDDDDNKGEGASDNAADQAATSEPGGDEAEAGGAGDGSPSPCVCTLPNSHVMAGCTAVVASVRLPPRPRPLLGRIPAAPCRQVRGSLLYVANAGDSRAVICTAGRAPCE